LIVPLLTSQWVRASREDLVEACSGQLGPLTIVARGLLRPPGRLRTRETMAAANGLHALTEFYMAASTHHWFWY